jgi:hypothetical protein
MNGMDLGAHNTHFERIGHRDREREREKTEGLSMYLVEYMVHLWYYPSVLS